MVSEIEVEINRILAINNINNLSPKIINEELMNIIDGDLKAFGKKDPAALGDIQYIFHTYKSFQAVLCYRLANKLYYCDGDNKLLRYQARELTEWAKINSGVEIHPAAMIGRRFVVDHGIGTVIGATSIIGDDCYILQCVILGALGIASNYSSKRHPTLGNNVEIGAFARILGDINIGDNVKISPYSIIKQDICENHNVILVNQYQIIKQS